MLGEEEKKEKEKEKEKKKKMELWWLASQGGGEGFTELHSDGCRGQKERGIRVRLGC